MDFMIVFDVIIIGLGIYLIYSSLKMKSTGELSTIVVDRSEMTKCRDKKGFIEAIAMKSVLFGIIALLFGVLGTINDLYRVLGSYFNIYAVFIFIAAWFWFTHELKKARDKFFY